MATANILEVSNLIAKNSADLHDAQNVILLTGNTSFKSEFDNKERAPGDTVRIKIPGYPTVQRSMVATATPIQDLTVDYKILDTDFYRIAREVSLYQELLSIVGGRSAITTNTKKAIVDNYAGPAFIAVSTSMEIEAAKRLKAGAFLSPIDRVAKLGSINTVSMVNELNNFANYLKFPSGSRTLMMNGNDYTSVANSLNNSFVTPVSSAILKTGRFAEKQLSGFNVFSTVNIAEHQAGVSALRAGVTVSSIDSTGTLLTLKGLASSSGKLFLAGDKIAIPSVRVLQPVSGVPLKWTLVVTVLEDANGDGAGNCQVKLNFPLIVTGPHRNVDSLPALNAAVEIFPNYNPNFAYIKTGLNVVSLKLPNIEGAVNSDSADNHNFPVKVNIQGSVLQGSNVFSISSLAACKVIPPYVISFPSIAG